MPIYQDDQTVKIGGVVLPGLIKSIEITQEATIDEVEVEGSAVKPKQAVGYEDAKIKVELVVDSSANKSALDKLSLLNELFKAKGQNIPQPVEMICTETVSAGIGKVLLKKLTYKKTNQSEQYAVTLELCQYLPVSIAVLPSTAKKQTDYSTALSADYQSYLDGSRGSAPPLGNKFLDSPATDNRDCRSFLSDRTLAND